MPIYEYACASCQHRFEVKQKVSDPPLSSCVRCGQAVTKVISAPAIMFKGSGWYITDYSDKLKQPVQAEPAGQSSNGQKESGGQKDATASSAPAQTAPATSSGSGSGSTSPGTSTSSSSTTPSNSSTATSS
jgi:putative FmdB family regulatory protein